MRWLSRVSREEHLLAIRQQVTGDCITLSLWHEKAKVDDICRRHEALRQSVSLCWATARLFYPRIIQPVFQVPVKSVARMDPSQCTLRSQQAAGALYRRRACCGRKEASAPVANEWRVAFAA